MGDHRVEMHADATAVESALMMIKNLPEPERDNLWRTVLEAVSTYRTTTNVESLRQMADDLIATFRYRQLPRIAEALANAPDEPVRPLHHIDEVVTLLS